jgi:methionyl-tRNA formyltransferase
MGLRIVFFGTPVFAEEVLRSLLENKVEVVAIVTKPDKPKKRSSTPTPPAVKAFVQTNYPTIPLFQPIKASTLEFAEILRAFNADLFIVVAYSEIIKEILLSMPRYGCINVHGSLLPKYRGAAPIQRAIMAGEQESGISIIEMVKELDAGPILAIEKLGIGPDETAGELSNRLSKLGAKLLIQVIQKLESSGAVTKVTQDHTQATMAPKITLETGRLDWNQPRDALYNCFRGVTPKPGAWCWVSIKGEVKRLRILKMQPCQEVVHDGHLDGSAGSLSKDSKGNPIINCLEGAISLLEVQLEGKKVTTGADFLRGARDPVFPTTN